MSNAGEIDDTDIPDELEDDEPSGAFSAAMETDGKRLLGERRETIAELAKKIGASKTAVHSWLHGKKIPSPTHRVQIQEALGIPGIAWSHFAGSEDGVVSAEDDPSTTTLDRAHRLLREMRAERSRLRLPSDLARSRDVEAKTLALIARLEKEQEMFEDSAVKNHPFWQRVRASILDALKKHPDAARDVAAALAELDKPNE